VASTSGDSESENELDLDTWDDWFHTDSSDSSDSSDWLHHHFSVHITTLSCHCVCMLYVIVHCISESI